MKGHALHKLTATALAALLLASAPPLLAQGEVDQVELDQAMALGARLAELTSEGSGAEPIFADGPGQMSAADSAALIGNTLQFLSDNSAVFCGESDPRTVVFQSPDGGFDVFVLSPATGKTSFPMAGHYRLYVSVSGEQELVERVPGDCVMADWSEGSEEDIAMQAVFIDRQGEPQPTALDFYISRQIPFSLGVLTAAGAWPVLQGLTDTPVEFD